MKRIISIILAALLTLSVTAPVSAEELFAETTETPAEVIVCEESDITDTTVPDYEDLDDNDEDPEDPEDPEETEDPDLPEQTTIRTEQEIRDYLNNHPVNINEYVTYGRTPKVDAPYDPGTLSDKSLNSALTYLNNYRFIAGVDPAVLDEESCKMAQAGSLLLTLNCKMAQTPSAPTNLKKPDDMDEELYQLGLRGANSSNKHAPGGMIHEFYNDAIRDAMHSGPSDFIYYKNEKHYAIGRTKYLKRNKKMGYGYVGNSGSSWPHYALTYCAYNTDYDDAYYETIAWPAREMPTSYFYRADIPWTLTIDKHSHRVNEESISNIKVKLTKLSDGRVWNFSGEGVDPYTGITTEDGYFNVFNNTIIFCPYLTDNDEDGYPEWHHYRDGERYHVEITGTSVGTVSYDVHFFSTGETPDPEDPEVTEYTVTFETNGGTTVDPITAEENTKIILPDDPTREGFYFGGWFTDPELTHQFNPSTKITSDLTLYAAWRTAPTYIVGQSIDIKSQYFSTLGASKYTVTLTESGEDASKYATVSGKGILTAKKPGNITVTPLDHEEAAVQITLLPKPLIKFPKVLTYQGQTINVYDYFADNWADYGVKPIKLVSSNTKVATIDEDGNITAKEGNGTTTISAIFSEKNKNGATNSLKFTAKLTVKHPKFAKASYQMQTGQKLAIGMSNVTKTTDINWSTSDTDKLSAVAQLDKKGAKTGKVLLTAYECGEYTLTANIDGHDYTCSIMVKKPAIKKATLRIKCGKTGTVALKDTKINKNDVVWKSSNEEIATVGAGGVVTAKSIGDVTIYTETGGIRNECVVTVW